MPHPRNSASLSIEQIVEKWSAVMDIESEISKIAVTRTHRDICRFDSSSEPEFQTFYKQLKLLVYQSTFNKSESGKLPCRLKNLHSEFAHLGPQDTNLQDSHYSVIIGTSIIIEVPLTPAIKRRRSNSSEGADSLSDQTRGPGAKRSLLGDGFTLTSPLKSPTAMWNIPHFSSRMYFDRGKPARDILCSGSYAEHW